MGSFIVGTEKLTKEYKARAALNLFMTNATKEQIPMENVWPIYRLRWQIELMFKIWKSICNIEKVKKVKKERLECYIYSKLIFIVLGWKTIWAVAKNLFLFSGKALSFYKAFKALLAIPAVSKTPLAHRKIFFAFVNIFIIFNLL